MSRRFLQGSCRVSRTTRSARSSGVPGRAGPSGGPFRPPGPTSRAAGRAAARPRSGRRRGRCRRRVRPAPHRGVARRSSRRRPRSAARSCRRSCRKAPACSSGVRSSRRVPASASCARRSCSTRRRATATSSPGCTRSASSPATKQLETPAAIARCIRSVPRSCVNSTIGRGSCRVATQTCSTMSRPAPSSSMTIRSGDSSATRSGWCRSAGRVATTGQHASDCPSRSASASFAESLTTRMHMLGMAPGLARSLPPTGIPGRPAW
jgi:hypothetical protein